MVTVGSRLLIAKGSTKIGIKKGFVHTVVEVTLLGADYGHQVKVVLQDYKGYRKSLYAAHKNLLLKPSFNLGNGTGIDKITVSV
jgi:hypothetical protein